MKIPKSTFCQQLYPGLREFSDADAPHLPLRALQDHRIGDEQCRDLRRSRYAPTPIIERAEERMDQFVDGSRIFGRIHDVSDKWVRAGKINVVCPRLFAQKPDTEFWLASLAVEAFGFALLVKGKAVPGLKDKPRS